MNLGTDYKCPCCGNDKYKHIDIETNKKRYETTTKASGLTKTVKIRELGIKVRISKEIAECLNCSYHSILSESETVLPRESKKETTERLAATRFSGEFLNPRPL